MGQVYDFYSHPLRKSLERFEIPEYMHEGILRYVSHYVKPGDFLTSVICNDLQMAVAHADGTNMNLLKNYVQWFYNESPGGCWGSKEKMNDWLAKRNQ